MKRVALFLSLLFGSLLSSAAQWPVANAQFPTGPYYSTGATGAFPLCTTDATGIDCVNKTASFYAPLKTSLTPAWSAGSGTPTFTRATTATVYGYAEAAVSGASQILLTIPAGIPRFGGARFIASNNTWSPYLADGTPIPDAELKGYLSEGAATNYFLNSGAPVTQTISLTAGTYTTWLTGTGSITTSAGTATATGYGVATAGTPNTITVTVAGTVVFTVAGTVTIAQVENTAFPTSYIATAGAAVARNADILTYQASGNYSSAAGSVYAEILLSASTLGSFREIIALDSATAVFDVPANALSTTIRTFDSAANIVTASGLTSMATAQRKRATSWGALGQVITGDGATPVSGTFSGNKGAATNITVGGLSNGTSMGFVNIRNVRIWQTQLPNTTLQALTQ